ncbi:MAG: PAS domain-containing protein [Ktedonobacterales bacterium]|nr:PAS domain-containing protein [Ktedonobacterales bacterium]
MTSDAASEETSLAQLEARYLRSEAIMVAVLNSISAHIAVLDQTGTIIAVNEGWKHFASAQSGDSEAETYVGENYLTVLAQARGDDAAEAPLAHAGITRVLRGEIPSYSLEYPCFTPDEQLWFLMQVTPLQHPDGGVVVAHIDITTRKHEELRKDLFISLASHELKTPLTSLRLLAQLVLRRSAKAGYTDLVPQLETLGAQTETLARIVNELMDVSRLNSDQSALLRTIFDIKETVNEVINHWEAEAADHHFRVAEAPACQVHGDRDRIHQVLMQLLGNAATFSPPESSVEVGIVCNAEEVLVSVRDEGIGIDPSHHEQIFEPFYQVAEFREKRPGMGMGLYLARQIVQRHGGRIWVKSARDAGATFTFTLPLAG